MSLPIVYDPRYQDFDSWAALMCEAYAGQQLQIPGPTVEWQSWAVGLNGIDVFSKDAIPDPYGFDNWQDWASAVINVVTSRAT